jgi:hypothetical protein
MQFIKNHYEKILLGAVLLGLVGVLVAMWYVIEADKEKMENLRTTYFPKTPQPLPPLDLKAQDEAMKRLSQPPPLDWSTTNRLFNPVQWLVGRNGRPVKIDNDTMFGPGAIVVTKIQPLYFTITLESAATNSTGGLYTFMEEDQSAPIAWQRRARRHYAAFPPGETVPDDRAVAGKNEGFKLVSVSGPLNNPDEVDLKLLGSGETVKMSKARPFRRVDGYSADLSYPPDKTSATDLRVGSAVKFGGDTYNIIGIEPHQVVLYAQSNQKRWTKTYAP